MAEYTINIVNSSGFDKDYVAFQEAPAINKNGRDIEVFTNAWITFSGILTGGVDTLTYQDYTYAFWGTVPSEADPNTTVSRYGNQLMDTSAGDSVDFVSGPPTGFDNLTSGNDINSGAFQIVTDSEFTAADNYLLGLSKPTQTGVPGPVATFKAEPGCTYDVIPVTIFYVAEGNYTAGDIINVKEMSSESQVVDFTGRSQTTATVTQDANGNFSVVYS